MLFSLSLILPCFSKSVLYSLRYKIWYKCSEIVKVDTFVIANPSNLFVDSMLMSNAMITPCKDPDIERNIIFLSYLRK